MNLIHVITENLSLFCRRKKLKTYQALPGKIAYMICNEAIQQYGYLSTTIEWHMQYLVSLGYMDLRLAASWHLVGQCNNEHACYVGYIYVWALKPWLAIVIVHQYLQKITNLTRDLSQKQGAGICTIWKLEVPTLSCHIFANYGCFFFQIWHAYVNLSPAYLKLLHMLIHQLGREVWTKMWECTLFWDILYIHTCSYKFMMTVNLYNTCADGLIEYGTVPKMIHKKYAIIRMIGSIRTLCKDYSII